MNLVFMKLYNSSGTHYIYIIHTHIVIALCYHMQNYIALYYSVIIHSVIVGMDVMHETWKWLKVQYSGSLMSLYLSCPVLTIPFSLCLPLFLIYLLWCVLNEKPLTWPFWCQFAFLAECKYTFWLVASETHILYWSYWSVQVASE